MMKRSGGAILGLMLAFGAWAQLAQGDVAAKSTKPARPTKAVDPAGCVTAECHGEVKAYKIIHGPVAANTCDACHTPISAEAHTFEVKRKNEQVCTYCHEFETGKMAVIHKPVTSGECLGCHNPHGGWNHSLVRERTTAELCARCHENADADKKHLHHPVKNGDCSACHKPHASKYPKLLDATGSNLCLSCHREFASQMDKVNFTHKALNEGCTKCHDAHGSEYPNGLPRSISELCLGCHKTIKDNTAAAYKHPAALGERACLTCHTPHGGNLARLMADLPVRVCMTCHDKPITMKSGETLASMAEINDPRAIKHTPIRDGQCGGCHSVHGGDYPLLLRQGYSTKFHQNYSTDQYALCFTCHDERMIKSEQAGGVTRFRNGNLNLHYVHVAKGDLGRSCNVCHGTHTGKFTSLIRESIKYGQWPLPIRFQKSPTGATCATGCHPVYSYDREKPVPAKTAVMQVAASPRHGPEAEPSQPVVTDWSARDIQGHSVSVPAGGRPSILLFLRADQDQSHQAVKMAMAALPEDAAAQVVVVFVGPQAREHATGFAAARTVSWPIVADEGYALARPLGVEAWPTTLVIAGDGAQVAHLAGAPTALTMELKAYLDLAAKKIDRGTLDQRLASNEVIGGGPGKRIAWYLETGRKLRNEAEAEKALGTFADGLQLYPESVDLQVEMVRTLAELKQASEGLDLLDRLPAGAVEDWERGLLRGRMMAHLGRWDEARRMAAEVLAKMPGLGQAHYLMGMIHEHDRNFEKAAEAYRAAFMRGAR